jgi:hypothetical protein
MKMFIFNTNHRRHLTAGQGAAIAWDVMPMLKAEARERQLAGKGADGSGGRGNKKNLPSILTEGFEDNTNGESRDAAARLFNTSAGYISYAGRPQRCYSPTKSIKSVTSIGNPVQFDALGVAADNPLHLHPTQPNFPGQFRNCRNLPALAFWPGLFHIIQSR